MKTHIFDGNPQAALAFLNSELEHVEQEVLRQPYPEIKYPEIVPVDTSAPEYIESISFKTLDFAGEPKLLGDKAGDIPLVEIAAGKGSVSVHTPALGYDYTIIELGKAAEMARHSRSAAISYLAEKPIATRTLTEQYLDKVFIKGDGRTKDMETGLINDPDVPTYTTGTLLGGASETIAEIMAGADAEVAAKKLLNLFNRLVLKVYVTQTNSVFRPTHILLPLQEYGEMLVTRIPNTSETLVSYLERVLKVKFEGLIHLAGAGAAGANRMMAYTRDKKYVKGHLPMPFNMGAPGTRDNVTFSAVGLTRTAGTEIRIPKAHAYCDGI
jgi:hypothetical protein